MGSGAPDDGDDSVGDGGVARWVLLEGNRLLLAAVVSAAFFALLLALDRAGAIAFQDSDAVNRVASGLIPGTFTIVTLVVTLDQLVYSREFRTAGEARDQIDGVVEFRNDVEELTGKTTPTELPSTFFLTITETLRERARELAETVDESDEEFGDAVTAYAEAVESHADTARSEFEGAQFGKFEVIGPAIAYDESRQTFGARQLIDQHGDRLSPEATSALEDIANALEMFAIAREHFKTTYVQRELTQSARYILYVGIPAVSSSILLGLVYGAQSGAALSANWLPIVASALIALAFAPLAVLTAYGLRAATIARKTATVGPMVVERESDAPWLPDQPGQDAVSGARPKQSDD